MQCQLVCSARARALGGCRAARSSAFVDDAVKQPLFAWRRASKVGEKHELLCARVCVCVCRSKQSQPVSAARYSCWSAAVLHHLPKRLYALAAKIQRALHSLGFFLFIVFGISLSVAPLFSAPCIVAVLYSPYYHILLANIKCLRDPRMLHVSPTACLRRFLALNLIIRFYSACYSSSLLAVF